LTSAGTDEEMRPVPTCGEVTEHVLVTERPDRLGPYGAAAVLTAPPPEQG
jgi:hypothetical protein